MVLLICHGLFRGTKLLFHLLAVVNLSDSLENDPVVHIESLLDDEDVVQLFLDHDLDPADRAGTGASAEAGRSVSGR